MAKDGNIADSNITEGSNVVKNQSTITGFYPKFKNPSGLVLM